MTPHRNTTHIFYYTVLYLFIYLFGYYNQLIHIDVQHYPIVREGKINHTGTQCNLRARQFYCGIPGP